MLYERQPFLRQFWSALILKKSGRHFFGLVLQIGVAFEKNTTLKTKMKPVLSVNENLKMAPVCQSPTGCNLNYFLGDHGSLTVKHFKISKCYNVKI